MANNLPVTPGVGKIVATEEVAGVNYQQIQVFGPGGASVMGVNPDRSINVSVIGNLNMGGSVIAIVQGSVLAIPTGNQSVSGTVNANITGSVIAVVQGSVVAIAQGNQSVSGAVTAPPGSVMTTNQVAGSIMAVTISGSASNSSVMLLNSANVIGSVAALQGTNPWFTVRPAGSVTAIANLAGSVAAVSATAPAGSVMTVAALAGSVIAVSGATTTTAGSVISSTAPAGSVMAVRTDNASVITTQVAGSIMSVSATQPAGSIMTVVTPAGSVQAVIFGNASLVGTYAEDAPSASGDKGFLVMGARNDTLASVTSADGDYSSHVVGPSGELIIAPAPITKWYAAQNSVMYGVSVLVVAAPGTSIFNYLSAMQVANDSATFSRVKITGGLGSVLAWTVAPANGGSNIPFNPPIKVGENSGISVSISGVSSVYVNMQGFTAKI